MPAPRKYYKKVPKLTNSEILQKLNKNKEKLTKLLQDYSNSRPKGTEFEVQGFKIRAINEKNAIKSVRQILAQADYQPDLTLNKLNNAIWEIERRIEEELLGRSVRDEVKAKIKSWAADLSREVYIKEDAKGDLELRIDYWKSLSEEQITDLKKLSPNIVDIEEQSHDDDDGDDDEGRPIIRTLYSYRLIIRL